MENSFSAEIAFSRNIGWITEQEAGVLSQKRVAIAGLGGVGGHYAEVLARLGVHQFSLADFDHFEIQNFNRQNASGISSLGQKKIDVISSRIRDINPGVEIRAFSSGLNKDNLDAFLEGVDLYIDGLDFFALSERVWLFRRLRELKIPAVTVAPVGMGASLIAFTEGSMSFEKYFAYSEQDSIEEQAARFLVGLTPTLIQTRYLSDVIPSKKSNFSERRVPSTPMGCYLCAGVAGTMALKILLGRGKIKGAPWSLHYDAYLQVYKKRYLWFGGGNPIQRLKSQIVKKMLQKSKPK